MSFGAILKGQRRRHLVPLDGYPLKVYVEELPIAELQALQSAFSESEANERGIAMLAEVLVIVDDAGAEYRCDKDNKIDEINKLPPSILTAAAQRWQEVVRGDYKKKEENFS